MPEDNSKNDGSDIRLRELRVLRAIVTTGTTTAAADVLGISQPAVSRTVAQLEERLGRVLFAREGGRLLPTSEALGIDAELDVLFNALDRIENPDRRAPDPTVPLRIAAPPTIAHRFLPGPVADFSRRYPDQTILIDVLSSDVLVTQVAEGRVDIALSDAEPNHAAVRVEPFRASHVVCLMRRENPLSAKQVILPEDLDGLAYVAQTRRHSARVAKDRALAAAGVQPRITIETATVVSAAELVREGLGVALINPFPTALRLDASLTTRPFEPTITLQTSFLSPIGTRHSPATLAFMAMVRARANQTQKGDF
ncbi:LysR family transcriptional regulator [Roseinatronobacter alkalisoli]|uniref:LysR family transcriptional regulator n=1 Tax=Roseinatronobacter alkalisoli TaxID=3028235 RepID=A0ABT5TD24_9RHOB|nr:LysR family transcriptional regulator [Roseinatronobacter sp. HJB301]MDD7972256.1 LysR family transcriptional regulator [Roseinatronobacter sp. HJB301]